MQTYVINTETGAVVGAFATDEDADAIVQATPGTVAVDSIEAITERMTVKQIELALGAGRQKDKATAAIALYAKLTGETANEVQAAIATHEKKPKKERVSSRPDDWKPGIGRRIRDLIREGLAVKEIVETITNEYPGRPMNAHRVAFHRAKVAKGVE